MLGVFGEGCIADPVPNLVVGLVVVNLGGFCHKPEAVIGCDVGEVEPLAACECVEVVLSPLWHGWLLSLERVHP